MPRVQSREQQEVVRLLEMIPLTQTEIANHLGVSQGRVSQWKNGQAISPEYLKEIRRLARDARRDANEEEPGDSSTRSGSQSYGEWLAEQLDALRVTQASLAQRADVASLTISNVINGKTEPQSGTRRKIERALEDISEQHKSPMPVKPAPELDLSEPIVGNAFTKEEIDQAPDKIGVYVIHDKRGWPTYVGQGKIRSELKHHSGKKWATEEFAARKFSYAVIPNDRDVERIETILIKFMADSLLVNKKKRVSLAEPG